LIEEEEYYEEIFKVSDEKRVKNDLIILIDPWKELYLKDSFSFLKKTLFSQ